MNTKLNTKSTKFVHNIYVLCSIEQAEALNHTDLDRNLLLKLLITIEMCNSVTISATV